MPQQFCFALLSGEDNLRRYLLSWLAESGGVMVQEELELRIAMQACQTLGVCWPKALVFPNHLALRESQSSGFFGGGFYFNLEIASPKKAEVAAVLAKCIRKQQHREFGEVIGYFRRHYDLLPTIVLIDPHHGQAVDCKNGGAVYDRICQLRACLVLSHRITRWQTQKCKKDLWGRRTHNHSALLYADPPRY